MFKAQLISSRSDKTSVSSITYPSSPKQLYDGNCKARIGDDVNFWCIEIVLVNTIIIIIIIIIITKIIIIIANDDDDNVDDDVASDDDDDDDGVGHGIDSTSINMTQSSTNGKRLCVYY